MNDTKTQHKWDERQLKYANFVARGKTNINGERKSDEEFAKALGVDRTTMWRWTQQEGWAELLLECSLKFLASQIPAMNLAMVAKSRGDKRFKDASEKAYQTIMRQYQLMRPDKVDMTSDGKALPQPVVAIKPRDDA